jgi:prepilin-type N-terminal cleavage/methylation domain-containing protein
MIKMIISNVNVLQNTHKKSAFTMIELIMVIVVLGILAALAMPRMERDVRQEAADNILSAIRFTQHMALMDNVIDTTSKNKLKWQRRFWRFGKEGCSDNGIFYYVGSDKDTDSAANTASNINVQDGEAATDPSNGMVMMGQNNQPCKSDLSTQFFAAPVGRASPNIFLTKQYGIKENDTKLISQCPGNTLSIGFDYLGRPHRGFESSSTPDYSTLMEKDCNLTFEFEDGSRDLIVTIEKETGRAYQAN